MTQAKVILPKWAFEDRLAKIIGDLCTADEAEQITLDFGSVSYYIPGAIVAILSKVRSWLENGKSVYFENYETNAAFGYLQRIDFFNQCGLDLPESFVRHDSPNFVPIQEISQSTAVETLASEMAGCITSSAYKDALLLLQYACSEIVLNCKQHAGSPGFVCAQYAAGSDLARIAIADYGVGILESFKQNQSPFYEEGMTDANALNTALEPGISSTSHIAGMYGKSPNAGMGLSMLRKLMQLSDGIMFLCTGGACWLQRGARETTMSLLAGGRSYRGTICSVAFRRDRIEDYFEILKIARQDVLSRRS
jgi:anti-sigma regulatory factor (Ser/Thr protein kinase)